MSDWRGALGGVLPKVHTLDALMEVLPELGKYVKGGRLADGQQQESSSDRAGGGLERTESEEKEHEYALSVELMRKKKQENRVLLDSLKKAKESDTGSLYENEISLLRRSIREKQDLINQMNEKCMNLAAKTDALELEVKDQQDRTKEAREKLYSEAKSIEDDIKSIQEDRLCAVQRLHQYQLLHTRTKEDRDDAEIRMQKTKDLVQESREDLYRMKEFQNKAQHAEEQAQRELNLAVAKLEASRKFWKSSLEKKKREVASLITRYERSKAERLRRAEEEARRADEERAVQENERKIISSENRALEDAARRRKIRREQWGLVCAAAGLSGDASVDDVIQAYKALEELYASLKQNSDQNIIKEAKHDDGTSSGAEASGPQPDTAAMESHRCCDKEEYTRGSQTAIQSSPVSSETSPTRVQSKMDVLHHDDEAGSRELNYTCQRDASVKVQQKHTDDQSSTVGDGASLLCFIDQDQFSGKFEKLAQLVNKKDTKEASSCQVLTVSSSTAESSSMNGWPNIYAAELLGEKDTVDQEVDTGKEINVDNQESKPVLQREEIKSRSAKLKARLDKQRWMKHM